ncbi:MAG TPA: hypothetical protein VGO47_13400, partial [Chlamydiales bacterium]|nr:hypothetical protein [Chlamydiales bacterium]
TYLQNCQQQAQAIQCQIRSKLEYELDMVLPRLHGIHSLFKDTTIDTTELPQVHEFFELLSSLQPYCPLGVTILRDIESNVNVCLLFLF